MAATTTPGGADAALQAGVLQQLLLHRMELLILGHSLDGLDLVTGRLHREHQAGAHDVAVHYHGAGAAVAGGAALFGAGEADLVAQHVEQAQMRLAQEFRGLAVDSGSYVGLFHSHLPLFAN